MLQKTETGYRITTQFGETGGLYTHPHNGIDLAMDIGTPLESVGDGIVIAAGELEKLGKYVKIELENGHSVTYGHLSEIKSRIGERVTDGEIIALSGNTGRSTGPHLHLTAQNEQGQYINPEGYANTLNDGGGFFDGLFGWIDNHQLTLPELLDVFTISDTTLYILMFLAAMFFLKPTRPFMLAGLLVFIII